MQTMKIEELVIPVKKDADVKGEKLVEVKIYKLLEKCSKGEEPTAEEKEYIFHACLNARNAFGNGTAATSYGCKLEFAPWLKRFLVKYYGQLTFQIYFAFEEEQIRKNSYTRAGIVELIQA